MSIRPWVTVVNASTLVFLSTMTSFTPSQLYELYQEQWGLTPWNTSVVFAAYPACVIVALLTFGGLSDRVGRRPVLLGAGLLLGLGLGLLAAAASTAMLVLGRGVTGIASALLTAAAAAALAEHHPAGQQVGTLWNAVAVSLGGAAAPVVAGVTAFASDRPLTDPYVVVMVLLLGPIVALAGATVWSPGTRVTSMRDRRPRTSWRQHISVPTSIRAPFSIAGACLLLANLSLAVFGAFGVVLVKVIELPGERATGVLLTYTFAVMAAAQLIGRPLAHRHAMFWGAAAITGGWLLLAALAGGFGLGTTMQIAGVAGATLIGLGAGFAIMGSMVLVAEISPARQRAEVYSAYLVVGFSTLALTALATGYALSTLPSSTVLIMVASLSAVIAAGVGIALHFVDLAAG